MKQAAFVLLAMLTACTPPTWVKPGATQADFQRDKAKCIYDVELHTQNDPLNEMYLLPKCMQSKGYTKQ